MNTNHTPEALLKSSQEMTLKSLKDYSVLEIFLKAKSHLLTQKERSLLPNGGCAYRGDRGKKCAVGIFISDEEYTPDIENCTIERLYRWLRIDISEGMLRLLVELQRIHDLVTPCYWEGALSYLEKDIQAGNYR